MTVFYVAVAPLVPALHSVWFLIHIVAAAISGAAYNIGGIASILYLIKKRAENRGTVTGYLAKLLVNLLWFGQAIATAEACSWPGEPGSTSTSCARPCWTVPRPAPSSATASAHCSPATT